MNIVRHTIILSAFVMMTALLAAGCGPSSVVITPNYKMPALHTPDLKRDNLRIVNVTDGRKNRTSSIGTAHVGVFNQSVPFTLSAPVADVVKTMLDTMIVGRKDQERFIPINVSVDMFEAGESTVFFGEEGFFACNLRFSYPVTKDSIGQQVVFIKETARNGIDVTNDVEPLIYTGMAQCARTFVEGTFDKLTSPVMISADSVGSMGKKDSVLVADMISKKEPAAPTLADAPPTRRTPGEIAFAFRQGSKVRTGITATYHWLTQDKNKRAPWGMGLGLTFYDIDNAADHITGSFVSFGAKIMGKWYLSDAPTTGFVRGSLGLTSGNENIDYGTNTESHFFFGPTVEETIGLSFNRAASIEIGSFQLAHFGSKMLPSDVGFLVGLSFDI